MQDKISIGRLNDYYGGILNSHQQEIMRLYYDCDMSLAEISDDMGITRQAVREIIIRSTNKLSDMESKLGLVEKIKKVTNILELIIDRTQEQGIKEDLISLLKEVKEI
jgi:predicted DNA-binding protein YlxM (UPF0122 family)